MWLLAAERSNHPPVTPDPLSESLRALVAAAVADAIGPAVRQAVEDAIPEVARRAAIPPFLTKRELSELTGWSARKIDYARQNRTLPFIKRGRAVLFRTADVEEMLMEGYVPPKGRGQVDG